MKPLPEQNDWSFELLDHANEEIARVAKGYGLDTYPVQLEIITSEQMLDAHSSVGMPINYNHWEFGKTFVAEQEQYKRGQMGLAYEIVINSNPCIAYLMEENSLTMQTLVIAHAAYGHNSFFKGNYLFKEWTDAEGIIDYLSYVKQYVAESETICGAAEIEELLDCCHSLRYHGLDKYKRGAKRSLAQEKERVRERAEYAQSQYDLLWEKTLPQTNGKNEVNKRFPLEPEENLLYFIEKYSPTLEPRMKEIVRIVRKIAQYFYPQMQTKVMNEGWATFWHYTLLNKLYDEGVVGDGFMMEFLQSHTNVVYQQPLSTTVNPYALGFAMMSDIRRMCEHPTNEDREWFPELVGTPWQEALDYAMRNFKDESFILQYLSPKVIRDLRLVNLHDPGSASAYMFIDAIHDDEGYLAIRRKLANQYNLIEGLPDIQVFSANMKSNRNLILRHNQYNERILDEDAFEILNRVEKLWGFPVKLDVVDSSGVIVERHSSEGRKGQK